MGGEGHGGPATGGLGCGLTGLGGREPGGLAGGFDGGLP